MKFPSTLRLATALVFVCAGFTANAQQELAVLTHKNSNAGVSAGVLNVAAASTISARHFEANYPKMFQHFTKNFPNAADSRYYLVDGGLLIQSGSGQANWQVAYAADQKFSYATADLATNNIPSDVERMLHRYYKGYTLEHARRITDADGNTSHQLIVKKDNKLTELIAQDNELYVSNTFKQ